MKENEQFAIWQDQGTQFWRGAEVEEVLTNNRVSLKSELKNKPIVYYHRLCSLKEGREVMNSIEILRYNFNQSLIALSGKLKEDIDKLAK